VATGVVGQKAGTAVARSMGATDDQAGLVGDVAGIATGTGGAMLANRARQAAIEQGAPALRAQAEKKVGQALGATKERFKAMAARLTPEILKRGLAGNRQQILAQATEAADVAGSAIDDAITRYGARSVDTTPVMEALETAKQAFRTTALDGTVVVFEPRAVKQLDGLQQIVSDLGPNASVDQLVAIRRAWDRVVDQAGGFAHRAGGAIGIPLKEQTEAWAKREATGAIRKLLAEEVPELAAVNKEFAFWKSLEDVLTQTLQRTTPQQPGMGHAAARVAGTVAGSGGGITAAWSTGKIAQLAHNVFTSPRWRLADARLRNRVADALASGSSTQAQAALRDAALRVGLAAPASSGLARSVPNLAAADESTK